MKIIIIGGSQGVGLATAKAALAKNMDVTIFSRHPEIAALDSPNVTYVAGDVRDKAILAQAIHGHDVVICALGLPTRLAIGPPFAAKSYVLTEGTANIIDAMTSQKVKRLICVTAITVGDSKQNATPANRLLLPLGLRWLFQEKEKQEELIQKTNLEWTIVRPTALSNARHSRQLAATDTHQRFGLLSHVSRDDVAKELLRIIDKPATFRQAIIVSYAPRFGDSLRWAAGYFKIS